MAKRIKKVWGLIDLYETSACGIASYPDAHFSVEEFSLVKSISKASLLKDFVEETEEISDPKINLKMEEKETMEGQEIKSEISEVKEVKTEVVKTAEVETEKKSDMSEIVKAIKEGLKEGLDQLETERGLVEKQKSQVKSIGELAIDKGLFVKQ
jgi:predicted transcriptional regulator